MDTELLTGIIAATFVVGFAVGVIIAGLANK